MLIDIDRRGPIKADATRQLITDRVKLATRVNVLGYVQREGIPSSFNLVLGSWMSAKAVLAVFKRKLANLV